MSAVRVAVVAPGRWAIHIALFVSLLALAIAGVAVERTNAYTVNDVPDLTTRQTYYGSWDPAQVTFSATGTGENNGVTWSVVEESIPEGMSATVAEIQDTDGLQASLTIDRVGRGPDAATYTLQVRAEGATGGSEIGSVDFEIQPRPVRVLGSFTANGKTYGDPDGGTIANNNLELEAEDNDGFVGRGIIAADVAFMALSPVLTLDDESAGEQTARLTNSTLQGSDNGRNLAVNYELDLVASGDYAPPTATATIAPKPLALNPESIIFEKTYDGTRAITPRYPGVATKPTVDVSGVVDGDATPTITGSLPVWQLESAGAASVPKTVSISSGSYTLSDSNYVVSTTSLETAIVNKASLVVPFSVTSREYNGDTSLSRDNIVIDTATLTSRLANADSGVSATFTGASFAESGAGTWAVTLSGLSLSPSSALNNYTLSQQSQTGTITAKQLSLTGSFSAKDRPYDASTVAELQASSLGLSGIIGEDNVSLDTASLEIEFAQADASPSPLAVSIVAAELTGPAAANYSIALPTGITATASITPLDITFTRTAEAKIYNGATDADVTCSPTNIPDAETATVTIDCTAAQFEGDGRWTGEEETITVNPVIRINGVVQSEPGNYRFSATPGTFEFSLSQTIQKRVVRITGLDATDRPYNGGTVIEPTLADGASALGLDDVIEGDDVEVDSSLAEMSVGTADASATPQAVTVSGYSLSGTAADNYSLAEVTGITVTISKRQLTVNHSVNNKTYDGTGGALDVVIFNDPGNVVDGEQVHLAVRAAGASFDDPPGADELDRDVGENKAISVTGVELYTPDGRDESVKDNYVLDVTEFETQGNILQALLVPTMPSRAYDGSTTGVGLETFDLDSGDNRRFARVVDDVFRYDAVSIVINGRFDTQYVHTGNYEYTETERARIETQSPDRVTGRDAKNYRIDLPGTIKDGSDGTIWQTTGRIYAKDVSVVSLFVAASKTYDATTNARSMVTGIDDEADNYGLSLSSTVDGDTVALSVAADYSFTFSQPWVGEDIRVTASGFTLTNANQGGDASAEYRLVGLSWDRDITTRELEIGLADSGTFTAQNKPYDGGLTAQAGDLSGLVLLNLPDDETAPPTLTVSQLRFVDKNANAGGTTVEITAASLSTQSVGGDSGAEYSLTIDENTPATSAVIEPKDLDDFLVVTISNRTYNGGVDATISTASVSSGVVTGDDVDIKRDGDNQFTATAAFQTKTVGSNKPVDMWGLELDGLDASNYSLTAYTSDNRLEDVARAQISQKNLTLDMSGVDTSMLGKTYNGNTNPPADLTELYDAVIAAGIVESSDTVELVTTAATFTYSNRNQGSRTLNVSGYALDGTDAANYRLIQPTGLSATIGKKTLRVSANTDSAGNTTTYDGSADASDIVTLVINPADIVGSEGGLLSVSAASIAFVESGGVAAEDVARDDNNDPTTKPIEATNLTLTQPAASNYILDATDQAKVTTEATMLPFTLTAEPEVEHREFNGSAAADATCTPTKPPAATSDAVTIDCSNAVFVATADEGAEDVVLSGSGISATELAKTIQVTSISLGGADAGNYDLSSDQASTTAKILRVGLVLRDLEPNNKYYDGDRFATYDASSAGLRDGTDQEFTGLTFSNLQGVFGTQASHKAAGNYDVRLSNWTLTATNDSIRASNYKIDIENSRAPASILKRPLAIAVTAADRDYNATTNVSLTGLVTGADFSDAVADGVDLTGDLESVGVITGDTITRTPSGSFDDPNVGESVSVTVSGVTLGGASAANYEVQSFNATTTAEIRPVALTATFTVEDKVFDDTDIAPNASITLTGLTGVVGNDDNCFATAFDSARFADKNVDTHVVTLNNLRLENTPEAVGCDENAMNYPTAANYTLNHTPLSGAITPRTVSVTGTFSAEAKEYDRLDSATVLRGSLALSLANLVQNGSVVSAGTAGVTIDSWTASFDSNQVGEDKTVTLDAVVLAGPNVANYTVDVSGVTDYTEGVITPKPLTPTINVADRLWNGTTGATITTITLAGIVGDDSVSVDKDNAVAVFEDAEQGGDKTVNVTNIRFVQSGAWENYSLNLTETSPGVYSATTTASITGSPLTISIVASDKPYDGTTAATITVTFTAADNSTVTPTYTGGTATFAQADVGTNLLVTASGFTLTGADAREYVLTSTSATDRADITAVGLGITAADKVYDGTDVATVSLDGVIGSDDVGFATVPTATFDDPTGDARAKDVGVGKAVTATGITLTGDDSGNYTINTTETATASITQRLLTPVFTPNPTVNSATSPVSVDVTDDRITDDVLTVDYALAETIRRGNQLVLVVTGITLSDTDGANYRVVTPYEFVLQTFASPTRERSDDTAPLVQNAPAPQPAPRTLVRPAVPPAAGVERPVAPSPSPSATPTPVSTSPDILPGWRPATSTRATIDYGEGVLTRSSSPREIAERIKVEPPSILTTDRFDGFEPQAPAQLEIMGAKTVTSLRVSSDDVGNPERLRTLISGALVALPDNTMLSTDSALQVLPAGAASANRAPTAAEREVLEDALAWLGLAPVASGPGISTGTPVADVVWQLEGFRPGSSVFLVMTSDPGLVAWGTANAEGVAVLQDTLQADTIPEGEHRLRVIGTSVFDGGVADETGTVAFTADLTDLVAGFDRDTRISVGLWGANPEGADHVAVRYVDPELAPDATIWWWLLLIPALWLLIVLWRRRRGDWTTPTGRAGTATTGAILATPAIVVGVVLAQDPLVPAGVAVAVVAALVAAVIPAKAIGANRNSGRRPLAT